jgi:rhodanese-related sulfurtransferase
VGVLPQNALVEGIGFPPPAALRASTSPASGRGEVNPLTGRFNSTPSYSSRHSHPKLPSMTASVSPSQVRRALLLRDEIALLDLRHEAAFATGHPLFAANMAAERIALEAGTRLPRKDVPIVVYDAGEGLIPLAADRLKALGYTDVRRLDGGLQGWQQAGYELFQDVNSYANAFGELVESRRHTPSLSADEVARLIASRPISRCSMSGGSTNMRP